MGTMDQIGWPLSMTISLNAEYGHRPDRQDDEQTDHDSFEINLHGASFLVKRLPNANANIHE